MTSGIQCSWRERHPMIPPAATLPRRRQGGRSQHRSQRRGIARRSARCWRVPCGKATRSSVVGTEGRRPKEGVNCPSPAARATQAGPAQRRSTQHSVTSRRPIQPLGLGPGHFRPRQRVAMHQGRAILRRGRISGRQRGVFWMKIESASSRKSSSARAGRAWRAGAEARPADENVVTEGLDLTDNGCSNLDERPFDWWDGHQPNVGILRNEDPWGGWKNRIKPIWRTQN